jgi:hypothetical protein
MTTSRYKRLPGRGITWGGPSRVWLGDDHVLLVLTRGYSETYRRFFFHDIQGIVVRRTQIGTIWNVVWGFIFAFFAGLFLTVNNDTASIILACMAAPFAVALLVNVLLGPTCAFHIRTAVQTERLPAVSRVSSANKFIARIEPLITAAQGELPRDQLVADLIARQAAQSSSAINAPPVLGS